VSDVGVVSRRELEAYLGGKSHLSEHRLFMLSFSDSLETTMGSTARLKGRKMGERERKMVGGGKRWEGEGVDIPTHRHKSVYIFDGVALSARRGECSFRTI
jgi:hypothetical protein